MLRLVSSLLISAKLDWNSWVRPSSSGANLFPLPGSPFPIVLALGGCSCPCLFYSQTWYFLVPYDESLKKSLGNISTPGPFFLYSLICNYWLAPFGRDGNIKVLLNKKLTDCFRLNILLYLSCLDITDTFLA